MPYEKELHKLGPAWMQRENGRLFWGAVGKVLDEINAKQKEAAVANQPDNGPDDALPNMGKMRNLEQGPGESNADYRARLKQAPTLWGNGSKPFGLLTELKAQGFPVGSTGATIVQHNGRYYQFDSSDPPNLVFGDLMDCEHRRDLTGAVASPTLKGWTFEARNGRDQFYSQFGLVFPSDYVSLRPGTETAARLNAAVNKWKPGKANYRGCWVRETGVGWGWPTTQTWGQGGLTWGGNVTHFIPPT